MKIFNFIILVIEKYINLKFSQNHSKSTLKIYHYLVANLPLVLPVKAKLVSGFLAYLKLL